MDDPSRIAAGAGPDIDPEFDPDTAPGLDLDAAEDEDGEEEYLPAVQRRDGFTALRRAQFCEALAACGNVRQACREVRIAPDTAYRTRHFYPQFRKAWDAALVLAREHAEAVLAERALEGVEEVVFYHGEEVGRRRRFESALLLAHLARLDRRTRDESAQLLARDFGEVLLRVELEEMEPASEEDEDSAPEG
ncbi:MAG: hypothetical protein H6915_02345 [Novosphingobium sp.]|nr:hypothetical protein [Novosphingobium sp.]MCP5388583.1 hypothetical protein [Novosphingobium sp.]